MDTRFLIHNLHHESAISFADRDPHLRRLKQKPFQCQPALLRKLPSKTPGIYTLGGGRQVGKTTLLKQWMLSLLNAKVHANVLVFLSGELIETYHALVACIQATVNEMDTYGGEKLKYLFIDEVTYVKHWEKAIKYAADAGLLDDVVVMLTGSDLAMMQAARMTFPGRRGLASQTDFHLYPLSFYEVIQLTEPALANILLEEKSAKQLPKQATLRLLEKAFYRYLMHGGYLTAINDLASWQTILPATMQIYSDWIRGDVLKRNKQEHYLRELVQALLKHYGSQITWNNLSQSLSIDHHKTVSDYVALLQSMDAVFVQHALIEDKLTFAPKKAKKVMFNDPFIYHAMRAWLKPCKDPFVTLIETHLVDREIVSKLVESVVITHYRRFFETYYIKGEAEVDIAYINDGRFWPIEIKWREQSRRKELKQLSKYPNGLLLTKSSVFETIGRIKSVPLVWHLYQLNEKDIVTTPHG